jgi:5-methyltetrahydrofolate--homocysteine methyltransferase
MGDYLKSVFEGHAFLLFDGAMGTMLQKRGLEPGELPDLLCLTQPDAITGIHREYVEAGSQVVTTNTFGANARKLAEAGSTASVAEVFTAAVSCARSSGAHFVAADIGPIGELMFPMGELEFSEAYELFAEQARAAQDAGADLVIVETMADLVEMSAAVLAVKGSCSLPLFATMTFTAGGRTFLGTAPREAALVLALLGVDVLGVNCSAGPTDLQPVVRDMLAVAPCPVIVQANAGLPQVVDGETVYSLAPAEYARDVLPMVEAGAVVVGGCCGTDPAYLHELATLLEGREPAAHPVDRSDFEAFARAAADEGGRDGDLIDMILEAEDRDSLKEALADEFDE